MERANQTLQDRLTKELRLRSISSMREANAYLPEFIQDYNSRFACTPRSSLDGHRPLHAAENLDRILMLVERRVLSKNLTLSYGNVIYQIRSKRPDYTMRRATVEVREASTGEVRIEYKGKALDYSIYAKQERPAVTPTKFIDAEVSRPTTTAKHQYGPVAQTHPWKR